MEKREFKINIDFSRYRGKYVALVDNKVVSSATTPEEAWKRAKKDTPKTPELMKVPTRETLVLIVCK